MKKKQYKVKYENKQLKPPEPIDSNSLSLLSSTALEKIWNNEEDDAYNDL